ncbi:hypothetical protein TraAM80_03441 [Trypanosoma rangeli]|uniref:Uncharacterized protein n=1 Tax=Trypanosoma rangeli TaxID=5698 RepID=A0A3R7KIV1_TRYRA|nr:uncharacterized protein TraAM80_03441 [Trypanosoma rangeli]RNF07306.1 hypothetical protein TraAM80_03441 [Trypanosoma rangeli]|eukprot:RNF07306.1 hypothetical protein TraAM80_03441 [Trypanosoma rangeli]
MVEAAAVVVFPQHHVGCVGDHRGRRDSSSPSPTRADTCVETQQPSLPCILRGRGARTGGVWVFIAPLLLPRRLGTHGCGVFCCGQSAVRASASHFGHSQCTVLLSVGSLCASLADDTPKTRNLPRRRAVFVWPPR